MTLTGTFAEKPLVDRGLAVRLRRHEIKPNVIRVGTQTSRGYERAARRGPQGDEVTHLGRNRPPARLGTAATQGQGKTDIEAGSKPGPGYCVISTARAGCQPAAREMMNATVLPVSRGDSNAWVRVASHLFPARVNLATSSERCRPSVKVGHGLID